MSNITVFLVKLYVFAFILFCYAKQAPVLIFISLILIIPFIIIVLIYKVIKMKDKPNLIDIYALVVIILLLTYCYDNLINRHETLNLAVILALFCIIITVLLCLDILKKTKIIFCLIVLYGLLFNIICNVSDFRTTRTTMSLLTFKKGFEYDGGVEYCANDTSCFRRTLKIPPKYDSIKNVNYDYIGQLPLLIAKNDNTEYLIDYNGNTIISADEIVLLRRRYYKNKVFYKFELKYKDGSRSIKKVIYDLKKIHSE